MEWCLSNSSWKLYPKKKSMKFSMKKQKLKDPGKESTLTHRQTETTSKEGP